MYLGGGGRLRYRKGGRKTRWGRVGVMAAAIAALLYFNQFVAPRLPPPLLPTPTATRSPASYAEEAEAQFASGRLEEAIRAYQQAVQSDPDNLDYYVALARLQVFHNELDAAVQTAEAAISLNPDSSQAHAIRALALDWQAGRKGDPILLEEAANSAVNALRLDPSNALAHAYYAEILTDQQKWAQAFDEAKLALNLLPNSLDTHRAYGYVLESTGDYRGAVQHYEAALAINPNLIFLYLSIGKIYGFGLNEPDRAIENFQKAIALNPDNPEPFKQIAQMYAGTGEYGRASQYAAQALELDPANPALHGLLGRMYYHNRNYEGAEPELRLAVEGGVTEEGDVPAGIVVPPISKDVSGASAIYYTYGLNLFYAAKCDRALQIFQEVLETWPDDQVATYNAQEGIRLCQEAATTGGSQTQPDIPTPTGTP